jgi:UDP-glucose 4-epimerase
VAGSGLTVAVTGPTGEIGKPFVAALERSREVAKVVGMARRPFDPAAHGWKKVEYRRGDVLDRASVERLREGADVVVHLASRPTASRISAARSSKTIRRRGIRGCRTRITRRRSRRC